MDRLFMSQFKSDDGYGSALGAKPHGSCYQFLTLGRVQVTEGKTGDWIEACNAAGLEDVPLKQLEDELWQRSHPGVQARRCAENVSNEEYQDFWTFLDEPDEEDQLARATFWDEHEYAQEMLCDMGDGPNGGFVGFGSWDDVQEAFDLGEAHGSSWGHLGPDKFDNSWKRHRGTQYRVTELVLPHLDAAVQEAA